MFILYFYMEDQASSRKISSKPVITPNGSPKNSSQGQRNLNKYHSEPKFNSYKEQILKIPKVKQILNMDRHVYSQDIQKRLELIGSLKCEKYFEGQMIYLHKLRKPLEKKTKRHKTNFKIPLTRQNLQNLNNLISHHIENNQPYKNQEVIFLKNYEEVAPFNLDKLNFMDEIDKVKRKFKEKYPEFNTKILKRNQLTLENVILNRNIKRELKLDKKKDEKKHAKNVMRNLIEKKLVN